MHEFNIHLFIHPSYLKLHNINHVYTITSQAICHLPLHINNTNKDKGIVQ